MRVEMWKVRLGSRKRTGRGFWHGGAERNTRGQGTQGRATNAAMWGCDHKWNARGTGHVAHAASA